jgi:hypothetical protein
MRTIPEFITLRFRDEKAWRTAVTTFIKAHPNVHVNSTGGFDLVIPAPLEAWVRDHLAHDSYEIMRENDAGAPGGAASMWRYQGRGTSPEFDDPKWLADRTVELEKENDFLRNQISR